MPIFTAIIPACVALVLLVLHARAAHGRRAAAEFFVLAFLYFVAKENLSVAGYFHEYQYPEPPPLRIFQAPLGVVVGWLFTSYVAWTLAERILVRFSPSRPSPVHTVFVAMLVTATISYPMEALGTSLGWWHWTVDGEPWMPPVPADGSNAWVAIPPVPLFGWAFFVGGFLLWFLFARSLRGGLAWLRYPIFLAGSALHFQAIHSIGASNAQLFAVLGGCFLVALALGQSRPAASEPAPPPRAQPAAVRYAVEIALALMASVVIAFVVTRGRHPEHLLTLVPLALFWAAGEPRFPPSVLVRGWVVLWVLGVMTASPKVFSLGFFPMMFFLVLGARRLGARLRALRGRADAPAILDTPSGIPKDVVDAGAHRA